MADDPETQVNPPSTEELLSEAARLRAESQRLTEMMKQLSEQIEDRAKAQSPLRTFARRGRNEPELKA